MCYFTIATLVACNAIDNDNEPNIASYPTGIRATDSVYVEPNAEITPANAYSDLFLDTTAVEQYIRTKNVSTADASAIRSFYNYRNGQYAWFHTGGFSEQARGFWNLRDEFKVDSGDQQFRKRMDTLLNEDTLYVSRFDTSLASAEIALTHAYMQFYNSNRDKLQFSYLSPEKAIPVKKENTLAVADKLVARKDSQVSAGSSSQYNLIMGKLAQYTAAAKQGGWPQVDASLKKARKNSTSPAITTLKKRLQLSDDYLNDTSSNFTDSLEVAIKDYQQRHGLKPTGIINDSLIASLNVPVENRIQQLIINLNRAQWMSPIQDSNYIIVNIPDFMLTAYENNAKVLSIPVAVGKQGTNTTIFSGELNQIVFSPTWNIPPSIVKRDIVPAMKSDPGYLRKNDMEIVRRNDSLPEIRQLPGENNTLGKVKFLFPNRYDIYLHDTKAKEVFKQKNRAVSNGCIRLADAETFANYLLVDNDDWSPEKVDAAMNAGKEQFVKLSKPVPVVITYYTAWVDENGKLNFRDDVYGHDRRISQMMFSNIVRPVDSIPRDSLKKDSPVARR